jgi:hypothetical protein
MVGPIALTCLSRAESFAEKFRAALTRREVAARDFFDLDYAVRNLGLRADDSELIALVRRKVAVPGNEAVDVSERRLEDLRRQVAPQLQPVLRAADLAEFDVDRAFGLVANMAARMG